MPAIVRRPVLLLASGALIGIGASAALVGERPLKLRTADHFIHPDIDVYFRGTPIRGIYNVRQVGRSRSVRVHVSLHGLEPGTRYRVLASKRPCSRRHTAAALVFRTEFTTGPTGDDAYDATRVRRHAPLHTARTVRLYSLSGESPQHLLSFAVDNVGYHSRC